MKDYKLPIFILGCQRSGTSLLRRLLDAHSNIACSPESSFLVQLSRVFEIKRSLQGLLNLGFSEKDVLTQMRSFAVHFFEEYAKSKGKGRWADKTPHYIDHGETIDQIFEEKVLYIAIVRHGLDVAYSLSGFDWTILDPYLADGTEKPIAAARFWRDQNMKLLSFQEKVKDRLFMIRYEDLVTNPEATMKSVFEFLEEPWEPEILDLQRHEHDTGFEDPKLSSFNRIVDNSEQYKNWPKEIQKRVWQEISELCGVMGYHV